jgi:SpoIIAA-like
MAGLATDMLVPLDEATWPLVTVRWTGVISDATLTEFLARMDAWLRRGQRFALLLDSRGAKGFSPEQRRLLIGHMKQHADLTRQYLVQAIVLDNFIQRTLFYGINLIFPNPFPSKIFGDADEARAWLERELTRD